MLGSLLHSNDITPLRRIRLAGSVLNEFLAQNGSNCFLEHAKRPLPMLIFETDGEELAYGP